MLSNKPLFSVLMPTYNRSHLLSSAIKSVLQQTFEDFEIVISNGGSTDNTKDVVAEFNDPRIRYFESEKRLNIGDNYQNALAHATGEYISFLSDDDAFVPVMLERVMNVIDEHHAPIITFHSCFYHYESGIQSYRRLYNSVSANSLFIKEFASEVTKFEANQALKALLYQHRLSVDGRRDDFITPFLANAVYHNSVFSHLKRKTSNLFATTPADMYLAAGIFYAVDSYFCLDEPLHVWSQWADNATASPSQKGNEIREHYKRLLNGEKPQFTPLKYVLPQNLAINAILQARHDFASADDDTEIYWQGYYALLYGDLMYLKSIGIDVSQELNEFKKVLSQQPAEFKDKVQSEIFNSKAVFRQFLNRNLPYSVMSLLRSLRQKVKSEKSFTFSEFNGDKAGFSNVLEAANFVSSVLPK